MKNSLLLIFIISLISVFTVTSCSYEGDLSYEQKVTKSLNNQYPDWDVLEVHKNAAVVREDTTLYFVVVRDRVPYRILYKKKIKL